jgi:hypothetical protein
MADTGQHRGLPLLRLCSTRSERLLSGKAAASADMRKPILIDPEPPCRDPLLNQLVGSHVQSRRPAEPTSVADRALCFPFNSRYD